MELDSLILIFFVTILVLTKMGILYSANEKIKEIRAPIVIENSLLSWIAVASIFFLFSGATGNFGEAGQKYFVSFIIIGLLILIITAIDYVKIRSEMMASGHSPYQRTDYLFMVLVATIIIVFFMIFEALFTGTKKSKNNECVDPYI